MISRTVIIPELLHKVAIHVNTKCSNTVATDSGMKASGERLAAARVGAGYRSARDAALEQRAYRVVGTSMNKARLFDGDYVITVPYFMARAGVAHKDLVVVERRRSGAVERTVKEVEIAGKSCLLCPRSDDPRFQDPFPCEGPHADGTEIEIIGLVIGSFTPR